MRGRDAIDVARVDRALALLASVLACAGFADRALGADGNATNAKLCQQGGWSKLMDASAHPFAGQDACVSYAAHDGTMFPCVAGNVYSASASGTSVESLTYPKAPGIPVSSATVERTSTCP